MRKCMCMCVCIWVCMYEFIFTDIRQNEEEETNFTNCDIAYIYNKLPIHISIKSGEGIGHVSCYPSNVTGSLLLYC